LKKQLACRVFSDRLTTNAIVIKPAEWQFQWHQTGAKAQSQRLIISVWIIMALNIYSYSSHYRAIAGLPR